MKQHVMVIEIRDELSTELYRNFCKNLYKRFTIALDNKLRTVTSASTCAVSANELWIELDEELGDELLNV